MAHKVFRVVLAAILLALAANCFLKYLWWTAYYTAWSGIPKMAEQWKLAGTNASFNGWSFLVLEAIGIAILFSVISLRSTGLSGYFKSGVRLAASLFLAIAVTALFALALSWVKQGI